MRSGDIRAQTILDYATGLVLFVVVMAAVAAFVPSIVGSLTANGDAADSLTANRIADHLVDDALGRTTSDPAPDASLDVDCVLAFFDGARDDANCGFDNGRDLRTLVGAEPTTTVNVTVRAQADHSDADLERLCWQADGARTGSFRDCDSFSLGSDDVALARGSPLAVDESAVAERSVWIEGYGQAVVIVRVI